jgi:hypothetical protein
MLCKKSSFSSQIISPNACFCLSFRVVADDAGYWVLITHTFSRRKREKRNKGQKENYFVGFEVLTAVSMKMAVFWVRLHGATTQKTAIFENYFVTEVELCIMYSLPNCTIDCNGYMVSNETVFFLTLFNSVFSITCGSGHGIF